MTPTVPKPLLVRLAQVYRHEKIRHPKLRAATLAQWMCDSAGASSRLAQEHYNFGHLKWRKEMAPYATKIACGPKGKEEFYCKFATLETFINGYWAFLNRAPYSGWEERADDPAGFIGFIAPVYSASPRYAQKVLGLLDDAQRLLDGDPPADRPEERKTPLVDIGAIVIDPGHGGSAAVACSSPNNAISASGVKEKKLTLDFALVLRDEMLRQAGKAGERVKVVLTREGDVNLTCHARAGVVKTCDARAFLSLHFNGSAPAASGVETFFRAPENGNVNADSDTRFARLVQDALLAGMRPFHPDVRDRGVKPDTQTKNGAIGVLNDKHLGRRPGAPRAVAALAELEFITNPKVDRLIVSGPEAVANRARVAGELAKALRLYLKQATLVA